MGEYGGGGDPRTTDSAAPQETTGGINPPSYYDLAWSFTSAYSNIFSQEEKDWILAHPTSVAEVNNYSIATAEAMMPFDQNVPSPPSFGDKVHMEIAVLRMLHPDWTEIRIKMVALMNVTEGKVHYILQVAGLFPVLGEFPDLADAALYVIEGDKTNAVISLTATMPVAGIMATPGRWVRYMLKYSRAIESIITKSGLKFVINGVNGENRIQHVMRHLENDLSRPYHTYFYGDSKIMFAKIDEAWEKIKAEGISYEIRNGNWKYVVDMGEVVGRVGGSLIEGQPIQECTKIAIVVRPGTNQVVTCFPSK